MSQNNGKEVKNAMKKRPAKTIKSDDEDIQECDFAKIVGQYNPSAKKQKPNNSMTVKQQLQPTINQLYENRKQANEASHAALLDLRVCLEADYEALKENEAKIQRMAAGVLKCTQQATSAAKQKLDALDDIKKKFKDQCEELSRGEQTTITKMSQDLKDHINQLQAKLASDVRRQHMDKLRKSLQAMHDE